MDTTMTQDYLAQLLANMQKQLDRIENKTNEQSVSIGTIENQTQTMSKDIEQNTSDIKKLETVKGKKLNIEPRTLYLFALASLIALIIVATMLGVNIKGIVGL